MPQKASKKSSGATEVSPCVSVCLAAGRVLKKIEFVLIVNDDNVCNIGNSSRELTTRKMIETLMVVLIFESWLDWQPWSGEPHLIEKTCFVCSFTLRGSTGAAACLLDHFSSVLHGWSWKCGNEGNYILKELVCFNSYRLEPKWKVERCMIGISWNGTIFQIKWLVVFCSPSFQSVSIAGYHRSRLQTLVM